ncbi:MAG TPA: hypothetical protein VJ834_12480 [Burkholderiales bacterium]|nr:hypothetical protein [Burkholderiales bacterium]
MRLFAFLEAARGTPYAAGECRHCHLKRGLARYLLMLAWGMKVPATSLPEYAAGGVAESRAHPRVDSTGFDEENVLELLAGET